MSKSTGIQNRLLAVILTLMIVIAMIPINVIPVNAATEDYPDDFTITVKDSKGQKVDEANVDYSVKVNGEKKLSGKISSEKGIAIIEKMDTLDIDNEENTVTVDAVVTKKGYEKSTVTDKPVTEANGNLDVVLNAKETVEVSFSVKDSEEENPVSDVDISINGYDTVTGKTHNGLFKTNLYKGETYSLTASKKGYKSSKKTTLSFDETTAYEISLEAKLIDNSFKFDEESPSDIEFGNDTYVNKATCSKSSGSITYDVKSGDSVSVNESSGKITTLKAGTSTIEATLAEDDDYQESIITYQITVTNAPDSGFGFADPAPINRKYVKNDTYSNIASGGSGTGKVTYAITDGNAATVDKNTGELTINKAGTVEVTATREADDKYKSISVSYTLTIEKADQAEFKFDVLSPEDQFITRGVYINKATGGSGDGNITYSVISGDEFAEIKNSSSSTVTLKKVGGPVVIKAVKAEDERYNEISAEYTLYIKKSPQTEMKFDTTVKTLVYSPNLTFSNPLNGGSGTGAVTYEVVSGDAATIDENSGVVSVIKASDENGVVIKATKASDDKYEEQTAQFTLIVNKAQQTGFAFADGADVKKTWSPDANTYMNNLSGGQSSGEITYSIVGTASEMPFGGPCASFDDKTGIVTMHGKGTITIKAIKAGDDCYEPVEAQYTLTISRASQSGFDFASTVPTKLTYNDNDNKFDLATVGGNGAGTVSYSVESGDAVSINNDKVTVLKAGKVTIKAIKADTNSYESASATIDVTIEKAEQFIVFEDVTTTSIVYGNGFKNSASEVQNTTVPDGKGYAPLTNITYSVVEGDSIVSVDDSGKLSFKNNATGKVTIKASKQGDDCYKDTSATYSLDVVFADVPATSYRLEGDTINESGWYSGDVTIIPAEGYKISYSNDLTDNTWADELVVSDEGYNGKTIYLKGEAGISDAIIISENDIRIDKSTPQNLSISYSESVLDTVIETVTFGFYKAPVIVTIEAYDEVSNIASFDYKYGDTENTVTAAQISYSQNNKKATATFSIPAQYKGNVSFKATDTAGNTSEKHDDKVIIVDDIAPGVTVSFDNNNATNSVYYSSDRTATICIDEANFFVDAFEKMTNRGVNPETVIDESLVISVNKVLNDGTQITKTFKNSDLTTPFSKESDGKWKASLAFDENADYTFSIDFKDFSGNSAQKYETSFTIDKIKPTISISYDNNEAQNENYYKDNRNATIKVVEHNFHASDIVVEAFSANDVTGNAVSAAKDYQTLLRNGTWKNDGDNHEITIPFDVDANYSFKILYSDLAENEQTASISDTFTVDKVAPTNLKVSYSTSVIDTILDAITFGFYNEPAVVTISAEDITGGVDFFTYSYGVQVGASSTNFGKGDTVISSKDIKYSDDGKTATATFTIPAQFRGCVSFTATDKSGNESETLNDTKVIVVDDVAPGVTVSYDTVNSSNETYYNTNRTATITIKESNFFNEAFDKVSDVKTNPAELIDEHLVITVSKTDNEDKTVTKTVKNDTLTTPFTKTNEDTWSATLLFDEDADYSWTIEYKDFSGNISGTFKDSFTVDKINPVISISYDNNEALNKDHYKNNRTATVTIDEHNFRPSDIVVSNISAVDVQGNSVDYEKDYQKLLREGTWNDNGNIHTLTIPFDVDARYSFEITYSDLANNSEKAAVSDEFCVDKAAPVTDSLKVSYSSSVIDTILDTVTFGFYNAPVTVTIEADDVTSGVDYFTYSYKVAKGESETNKGKTDIVIQSKDIKYTDDGKHASATFSIEPQYRGKVSFTATDKAGNTSEVFEDGKVIVVDNVAPGVSVTYDNNSASYDKYYNKARTATIKINEANFFDESFDKVKDATKNTDELIDEHLVITVTKEDNDGKSTSTRIKSKDLTTPFIKSTKEQDTWQATLLFNEDADYTWSVEYKDFSGASAGKFKDSFTVDNIDPVIEVVHSNNDAKNEKFFKANRPVTINITEHNFNAKDLVVSVTADKETGEVEDYAKYLTNPDNWTSNGNIHTAKIVFSTEAYYTFDISYVDKAGRSNQTVKYGDSKAPKSFVIDKTAPTKADITIDNKSVLQKNGVAFEKFYKKSVEVKYTVNCDISGLDNITYQKVDSVAAYSENGTWKQFNESVTVKPSEKFIIYFRAEDKAGNVKIVNSTGIVVDNKAPVGEKYAPEIDIKPEKANENGLHNSNVEVELKVVDPKYKGNSQDSSGYYSGLKKITYKIYTKDTTAKAEGVLLDLDNNKTSGATKDNDKLISEWNGKITVSAKKFNSNNVIVELYAVDNAGNERTTKNEDINRPIRIDITKPAISVSYQDGSDNGDAQFSDSKNGAYFKKNRTATITITERNFDADKVKITATKDDKPYNVKLSNWSTVKGSGNADGTTHKATITYSADGIYTFKVSCKDKADNANTAVNYSGLSPKLFTIDKTSPTFRISYDNNSAQNGNYYKAQRTATLTIEEHNFETSRIRITLTATDNGRTVTAPSATGWSTNGDTHTATITYSNDALYNFDIEYNDKAGNPLREDFQKDTFYVDKTNPSVTIKKIVDKSANNDEGNIGYIISATDTNFDVFTPVLTAIVKDGNSFKKTQIDAGAMSTISNGRAYSVSNLDKDGVYRITCTVVDKAGNAYSEVTLSKDRDGNSTYVEKRAGNDTLLTFSVNRDGSTFDLNDKTVELLDKGYVQRVNDDIVIDEINADTLEQKQVTLNDKKLKESDYKVEQTGGSDNWYKYRYTIDKSLFENEGEYNVVVSSKDRATNDAFSDVKDAGVNFVVDRTAPVVTVTGLSNDGRYQTEKQTVTAVPTDDGGELKSIVVTLVGQDGKSDKELLNLSGKDFEKALETGNGKVAFDIPEGLYQNVRIVCDDKAYYGKEKNVIYDETFTNVSVTPSAFLIYWANKPLRYATLGGILAVAGAIIFLVIRKKKKIVK